MKLLNLVSTATVVVLSSGVNAALIDNGLYTTDTSTGLDWLDLAETADMLYSQALSSNNGWRPATYIEVENLFGSLFTGYYDTEIERNFSRSTENAYANQTIDVNNFQDLFGVLYTTPSETAYQYTYGLYSRDETSTLRMMGAVINSYGESTVYGMEYTDGCTYGFSNLGYGTYLVRTSVVPIPAAIWLFGASLISLIAIARRKKA